MMIRSHNTILLAPRQIPNTHKQTNQINSPLTHKHRIKPGGIAFKLKQRVQSLVSQKNLGLPSQKNLGIPSPAVVVAVSRKPKTKPK
jgi:hypothetical protein